jgi:hypothetical protein
MMLQHPFKVLLLITLVTSCDDGSTKPLPPLLQDLAGASRAEKDEIFEGQSSTSATAGQKSRTSDVLDPNEKKGVITDVSYPQKGMFEPGVSDPFNIKTINGYRVFSVTAADVDNRLKARELCPSTCTSNKASWTGYWRNITVGEGICECIGQDSSAITTPASTPTFGGILGGAQPPANNTVIQDGNNVTVSATSNGGTASATVISTGGGIVSATAIAH